MTKPNPSSRFGSANTGWRGRIGFLIPSATPTVEREMTELAPSGVSVHFNRMIARGAVGTLETLLKRAATHVEHMDETVEMLASVKPNVIVLAHTATSYYLGEEREEALIQRQRHATGIPYITAVGSVVAALQHLGARTVAVGTAYDEGLSRLGAETIERRGFVVANTLWLPDVRSIFEETEERVYRLARQADRPEADAVFISGVGLPTLSVLQALEDDLKKPVISSASAMMWNALRQSGIRASLPGYGRLLADV